MIYWSHFIIYTDKCMPGNPSIGRYSDVCIGLSLDSYSLTTPKRCPPAIPSTLGTMAATTDNFPFLPLMECTMIYYFQNNTDPFKCRHSLYTFLRQGLHFLFFATTSPLCTYTWRKPHTWRLKMLSFKGIVQRNLTGAETRLKKFVLLSYSVGKFSF
jgi:hypothetical protein